jgi:tetratricopeptide (TPR) repeat protein
MQGFALFGASWAHASRGDVEAAIAAGQGAIEVAPDQFTRAAAQGLTGFAYVEAGRPDVARPLLEASLGRFRAMGNRNNESRFLVFLAECELLAGDTARAAEALEIARATRSRWYEALALRTLGRAAHAAGAAPEAVSRLTAARDLLREIGGRYEVARTELHLAEAMRARGGAAEARTLAEAARDAFRALDVPVWLARAEAALGSHFARRW